ncbi:GNAT family N-acetyltransferase [Paenibacillus sp. J22TS3]|uniref:GNAT family N-acetyltransferase n=1 Tax=Paenibacillus sp. J22TS3 TaxID=2807192 RepID=UPI001B0A2FA7|nr:GNAT family protein [Paenibacillus sp. J22TS3]GIP23653.1 N-acetyltransferase [Paenibacillus sp. J22TS3]
MYRCRGEIPDLETSRLRLRKLEDRDASALFQIWGNSDVVRFLNMARLESIQETREMIDLLNGLSESEDTLRWGIELKETGGLIGSCGFNIWQLSGADRGEIGYDLGKPYWGQGYMPEALSANLKFGYSVMGLNRIEALVLEENKASQRVLDKLGFKPEGLLREYQRNEQGEGYIDLQLHALLKREYREWGSN